MDAPVHKGPLHLQRHLTDCTDTIADIIRKSVQHSITLICSLHCECMPSGILPAINLPADAGNSIASRTAEARKRNIESGRGSAHDSGKQAPEQRQKCRFFSVKLNDEQGVVHSFCRRCSRKVLVYDRDLYWGVPRQSTEPPATFPYKCTCGSHMFEIAVGFDYPDDAMDENDINTITVAVRCASCNEVAIIFDDEAT